MTAMNHGIPEPKSLKELERIESSLLAELNLVRLEIRRQKSNHKELKC